MDYDNRVSLVSWNVNGLIGANRISQLITRLEVEGFPDFVCLQETHSDNREVISGWCSRLSGYKCYFGHGDGRNKGTAILVNRLVRFYLNNNGLVQDVDGRYTILKGFLGPKGHFTT